VAGEGVEVTPAEGMQWSGVFSIVGEGSVTRETLGRHMADRTEAALR